MSMDNDTYITTMLGRVQGRLDMIGNTLCNYDDKFDKILTECQSLSASVSNINQRCFDREKHCGYKACELSKALDFGIHRIDSLTENGINYKASWRTVKVIAVSVAGAITATLAILQIFKHV